MPTDSFQIDEAILRAVAGRERAEVERAPAAAPIEELPPEDGLTQREYHRSKLPYLLSQEDLNLVYQDPARFNGDLVKERFKTLCNMMVLYRATLMADFYHMEALHAELDAAWKAEGRIAQSLKTLEEALSKRGRER